MEKKFAGRVWKLPDDVDTDIIIAARLVMLPTVEEMSKHCMEILRPEMAKEAKPGDIIVAGKNFGCGSSREMAPECIKALGITCIIAKSFARIFFRNAINNGMLLIESQEVPDAAQDMGEVTVEVNKSVTVEGKEYPIPNIPENLFSIIQDGGLVLSNQKKNRALKIGGDL